VLCLVTTNAWGQIKILYSSNSAIHNTLDYLGILTLAVGAAGCGLWYLTRNEDANRIKDQLEYDERRRNEE
jgi:hypothetical protein